MIQIHFSAADLGRVVFPADPEPLWEAALAARALSAAGARDSLPPVARRWRQAAAPLVSPSMRPLFKLIAPSGWFPDFLTPTVSTPGVKPAAELLAETPAEVFREELDERFPRDIDPYLHGLRSGQPAARQALGTAVVDFHQQVLAQSSEELSRRYAGDLAQRAHTLMHGGAEALLSSLHSDVEWSAPVLTVHTLRASQNLDVHLRGRGLQLYPSPLIAECLVDDDPRRRPILIYPCADGAAAEPHDPDSDSLAALLGRTRAAVLRALITPGSTTQLARRVRISLASASEHTRILRAAALITTHRSQGTSLHSLTPTAHTLLMQNS
ncbi:winged helix-turn-helix domain-containing protein [Kribbella sp. NPDC005582]|uniref:winged helix-turn-helix domain-containing protein n=1 Tax=Kribbella sp. NPDC005582 TaxID=3156893 RepID=UPI0033B8C7C0